MSRRASRVLTRLMLGTALAAAAAGTAIAVPSGEVNPATASDPIASHATAFQSPSGRIICEYQKGPVRLTCEFHAKASDTGDGPTVQGATRPKSCQWDWGQAVSVRTSGKAKVLCAGGVMVGATDPPALAYGKRWSKGGFICLSREDAVRCSTSKGAHGLRMSTEVIRVY